MDAFPGVAWFLDVHSFGPRIMYGWGDDDLQTDDPTQNFANATFDGKRGRTGIDPSDQEYREYMAEADVQAQTIVAERMQEFMVQAGDTPYTVQESINLYPTSGTAADWVKSRWYGGVCNATRIQALVIEFGQDSWAGWCPFYPTSEQYHQWMREVSVGVIELLLSAAETNMDPEVRLC